MGCEESTQKAVWTDGEYEYFNCPNKFLSDVVYEFIGCVKYSDKCGNHPDYYNAPNRYIDGYNKLQNAELGFREKPIEKDDQKAIAIIKAGISGRQKH